MKEINLSDVKITFGGKELAEFDGKLEISAANTKTNEEQKNCQMCGRKLEEGK